MLIFVGWVNRSRQDVIESLQEDDRVLCEQLGNFGLRRWPVQETGSRVLRSSRSVRGTPNSATRGKPWLKKSAAKHPKKQHEMVSEPGTMPNSGFD